MENNMTETYMFVRNGLVQRLTTQRGKRWPVAQTHTDAMRLAKWFKPAGVRPALVGSVPSETLAGHITMALHEGCIGACCVMGWLEDGSPTWGYQDWP